MTAAAKNWKTQTKRASVRAFMRTESFTTIRNSQAKKKKKNVGRK
jgi:hypothetical protein